jgi:hypothetical protein
MKKYRLVSLAIVLTTSCGMSFADQPSTTTQVQTTAPSQDPNEVVCETQAPTTGSLIGGARVCRTRHQWDEEQRNTEVGQKIRDDVLRGGPGASLIGGH